MSKKLDLTGEKFGNLVVIRESKIKKCGRISWECQCFCGEIIIAQSNNLKSGNTKSCGCFRKEVTRKSFSTHGKRKSAEYNAWACMIQRCYNTRYKRYSDHGGRGITVCDRWLNSFENFIEDMGERHSPKHSLERIDNNLGYSPDNCKWGTKAEQSINRRVFKNNTSGIRGVRWRTIINKWNASIGYNKKLISLGNFINKEDAIKARKDAELKYWNKSS